MEGDIMASEKKGIVLTWKALASVVVGALACVGAFSLVQTHLHAVGPTLTAADRLEIQELLARYMYTLDSCPDHNNGYDYADLYTEDGQFGGGLKGRDALARAAGRTSDGNCKAIRLRG